MHSVPPSSLRHWGEDSGAPHHPDERSLEGFAATGGDAPRASSERPQPRTRRVASVVHQRHSVQHMASARRTPATPARPMASGRGRGRVEISAARNVQAAAARTCPRLACAATCRHGHARVRSTPDAASAPRRAGARRAKPLSTGGCGVLPRRVHACTRRRLPRARTGADPGPSPAARPPRAPLRSRFSPSPSPSPATSAGHGCRESKEGGGPPRARSRAP